MPTVLAFTDPHGETAMARSVAALAKSKKPDLIMCPGDLTYFGKTEPGFFEELKSIGQRIFWIPGNHEDIDTWGKIIKDWPFMIDISLQPLVIEGVSIGGLPGNLPEYWPGKSKNDAEAFEEAESLFRKHKNRKHLVLLVHYAPSGCPEVDGSKHKTPDSGGSRLARRIIEAVKPDLVFSGHYHQCFHREDSIGDTRIVNPGPCGGLFGVGRKAR